MSIQLDTADGIIEVFPTRSSRVKEPKAYVIARVRNQQTQLRSKSGLWVKFALHIVQQFPTWEDALEACNRMIEAGVIDNGSFVTTVPMSLIDAATKRASETC